MFGRLEVADSELLRDVHTEILGKEAECWGSELKALSYEVQCVIPKQSLMATMQCSLCLRPSLVTIPAWQKYRVQASVDMTVPLMSS